MKGRPPRSDDEKPMAEGKREIEPPNCMEMMRLTIQSRAMRTARRRDVKLRFSFRNYISAFMKVKSSIVKRRRRLNVQNVVGISRESITVELI